MKPVPTISMENQGPKISKNEALLQRKRDRDQPHRTLMWYARRYIANLREILNFVMSYCSAIVYMYSTITIEGLWLAWVHIMIMKLCQLLNFRTSVSTDLSSFSAKALASETQPGDQSPGCVSDFCEPKR